MGQGGHWGHGEHWDIIYVCVARVIRAEILCKFRIFWLVIDSNCVAPVFQGVDLCVIMENRPHKTHCPRDFVQI